jgi:hypothetical protein
MRINVDTQGYMRIHRGHMRIQGDINEYMGIHEDT